MKIHIPKDLGDEIPLLPDGPCTAVVKDTTFKKNQKTGNYQMYVKWIVTSEMYQGEEGKTTVGEPILDNYSFVDQALWRLNNLCLGTINKSLNDIAVELIGETQGDIEAEDLYKAIAEKIKGQEANLILEAETYDGKTRTKVKEFGNSAESGIDTAPIDEIP